MVVRLGPTLPRLAWLTAAAAAAALTRAPGLALVALAAVAAAAGVLLARRRPPARRALAAAGAGALVGAVAGGAAIGFYLRNRSPVRLAHRRRLQPGAVPLPAPGQHPGPAGVAGLALRLYDGLWVWTRFNLPRVPTPAALVAVPGWSGCSSWPAGGGRRRPPPGPPGGQPGAPAVAAWGLVLAWLAGVYAMVASYDGNGGHLHPRYLFPGLAVLAVVGALGLDRLVGGRRGLWVLGLAVTQLALTAAAWAGFVTALRGRRPDGPADLARRGRRPARGRRDAAGPWPGCCWSWPARCSWAPWASSGSPWPGPSPAEPSATRRR